ncbi:MFS transporter [Halarcobacter ebronensis]|uniref:MFS transporter n=1 Tax=Halarcobacter ebronensis TaxID=1462615 RepID=A0A4Q1APK5_9BACT|nr:MFS transporter [Halarcobacter ebronensis]QKF82740.1 major facilitator superfamily transporter [Halarcobacter ebronensis]RXK06765.1 MFS transporter [Halarcobacter ebronensis]
MKKKLNIKDLSLLLSLYTSQYIGLAFFMQALIGILRQNGVSLENLGIIYMLGLFWVFRFLWAPFIDKIEFKKIGHYKGWIIIFQFLMTIILLVVSIFNVINDLKTIIILSILFAFLSSSQSIALDGFVYKSVFKKQRAIAMSIKTSSGFIGMVLGGGVGLILYTHIGWMFTLIIVATTMFIALIQMLFYKETKTKKENIQKSIDYKQYINFWKSKKKLQWLILLLLYPASISAAYGMSTPILVDLGWSLDKIGFIVHIVGYSIGILASFTSSWFIKKFGKKYILIGAAIGQTLGTLLLLVLFHDSSNLTTILVIGFIFSSYTPSMVIMSTFMMNQSSQKSPASQFAIQHSIFSFSGIIFSSLSVSLSGIFGYENIILTCSFIGLFAVYMSTKIDKIVNINTYSIKK